METIQQCLTQLTSAWNQLDSSELVLFGIFFAAIWVIAMVLEAGLQKLQPEG